MLLFALAAYVLYTQYGHAGRQGKRSNPVVKEQESGTAARLPRARGRTGAAIKWADEAYRTFHGHPATKIRRVKLPAPRVATLLGELRSFTYAPPVDSKRGRTSKGQPIEWRHEMGDVGLGPIRLGKKPKVYTGDDDSLLIIGGTQHFDPQRGELG